MTRQGGNRFKVVLRKVPLKDFEARPSIEQVQGLACGRGLHRISLRLAVAASRSAFQRFAATTRRPASHEPFGAVLLIGGDKAIAGVSSSLSTSRSIQRWQELSGRALAEAQRGRS